MTAACGVAAAVLALALPTPARAAANRWSDIVFAQPDGRPLRLDACTPAGPGPFPAVILIHGGAWKGGSRHGDPRPLMEPLTRAGFAWFSIDYRLGPRYHFPACLDDVDAAIRWVKGHAAGYKVDPDRIVLFGESAGGQLAAMAAEQAAPDLKVAAVVDFYGPSDLLLQVRRRGKVGADVTALLGCTALDSGAIALLQHASPVNFVRSGLPPFLIVQGTADRVVYYEESVEFAGRLKAAGVPVQLMAIPGGGHAMVNWSRANPAFKDQVVRWLKRALDTSKPKPVIAAIRPRLP